MAGDVRRRMVDGAVLLLAKRGLQGTSFADVLELTGAPRGSIYHHFPDGKDQLVGSAVELAGARALALLDEKAGGSALEVAEFFLGMWRSVLVRGRYDVGCAVLAVTVGTDSPALLEQTAGVFRGWRGRLAELLEQGGLPGPAAASFAAMLIASSEGAVVLSRAERSMEPFDLVAGTLVDQIRSAVHGSA
jgi:TetR/AcrR family transcriptional repressor of lmrAB and yxaGH operons